MQNNSFRNAVCNLLIFNVIQSAFQKRSFYYLAADNISVDYILFLPEIRVFLHIKNIYHNAGNKTKPHSKTIAKGAIAYLSGADKSHSWHHGFSDTLPCFARFEHLHGLSEHLSVGKRRGDYKERDCKRKDYTLRIGHSRAQSVAYNSRTSLLHRRLSRLYRAYRRIVEKVVLSVSKLLLHALKRGKASRSFVNSA